MIDANGTMLRVTAVSEVPHARHTVLGWRVTDIAETVARLEAAGVDFARYDGMGQDDHGVWTTPNGDRIAWFTDPDGNVLSHRVSLTPRPLRLDPTNPLGLSRRESRPSRAGTETSAVRSCRR